MNNEIYNNNEDNDNEVKKNDDKCANNIDSDKYKFAAKYLNDLSFLGKIYNKELTEKIVFGDRNN